MTNLGAMLRLHRNVSERDLRAVAADIGIGHATLCRIEQGKPMDLATWLKVQAWLLRRADRKEP